MKEVQKLLRRRGLDSIDWGELKRQDLIEVDDEGDDEDDGEDHHRAIEILSVSKHRE